MKWASALSTRSSAEEAVDEVVAAIREQLNGERPDLLMLFISPDHQPAFEFLGDTLRGALDAGSLIGVTGGGVLGGDAEVEHRTALAVTAAAIPGLDINIQHITEEELPDEREVQSLADRFGDVDDAAFIILPDPFSMHPEQLLRLLDLAFPQSPKFGGLASGGGHPGAHGLFLNGELHRSGAVVAAVRGPFRVETIVAQGCRPIGQPMFITRCHDNVLVELNSMPARVALRNLYESLQSKDRDLFRSSLFLGLEMTLKEDAYERGDFLIRNLMGVDEMGNLRIGALLQETSVAQFHLRDAQTSREDLNLQINRFSERTGGVMPAGGLLFSCLGRGEGLYGVSGHDSTVLHERLGDVPLGGFFCNGEIGPVHGQTFVHGYTSCFGLFLPE